ncbi:hypothetical protein Trydic_g4346 [Trypoxylus dichotomus]
MNSEDPGDITGRCAGATLRFVFPVKQMCMRYALIPRDVVLRHQIPMNYIRNSNIRSVRIARRNRGALHDILASLGN